MDEPKKRSVSTHTKTSTKQQKHTDEQFCPSCGAIIKKEAVFCPHCGVQVGTIKHAPAAEASVVPVPKDKVVAVVLAVFLGYWTWLYTYKKDAWKFWLNLALSILTLGIWGLVAWVWAIIDTAVKPDNYYQNFPN